jgi:hypothetical protein
MVRKSLKDPMGWLESSVNHSFVALIFRIVLGHPRGLGALDLEVLGFSFWKKSATKQ